MSLVILFHFLCTQHVSDINISIIRSLRLCCWITTSVVLFSVRCVLEIWWSWVWVVSVLQAEACNTECFPFQYSPYVTMQRGSSGRRSRLLKDTPKQYHQNVSKVNDNSPPATSASSSHTLDEAYNNQHHGVLYFRTVLDNAVSRLEGRC